MKLHMARQALPVGESYLAHPSDTNRSGVSVVTMLSTSSTELLYCDDQLRPKRKVKLRNVGVQKVIEQSDETVTIFGSEFHHSATAAVPRIYKDGGHRGFLIKPPYQSPWYTAAVATGTDNEDAATRDLIGGSDRQFVLTIIKFK